MSRRESALTPADRSLRARIGAHALHSQHDSVLLTAPARAALPASLLYFEKKVDPEGLLPEVERQRRAQHAKKSYFASLALKSARARSKAS